MHTSFTVNDKDKSLSVIFLLNFISYCATFLVHINYQFSFMTKKLHLLLCTNGNVANFPEQV